MFGTGVAIDYVIAAMTLFALFVVGGKCTAVGIAASVAAWHSLRRKQTGADDFPTIIHALAALLMFSAAGVVAILALLTLAATRSSLP